VKAYPPKVLEDEARRLWDEMMERFPDPDVEGLDEATADAILEEDWKKAEAYMEARKSPMLRQFQKYHYGRSGDECQLLDKDGSYLIGENGYPIQDWDISSDKRIVDRNGNQIYYSDGTPILAKKMSIELYEFLKREWDIFEDATEEDMWY